MASRSRRRLLVAAAVVAFLACAAPAFATTISGSLTSTDPTQTDRLFRDGVASTCAAPKSSPGLFGSGTSPHYDAYTFTNDSGSPTCVSVTLTASCTSQVFVAAYNGSFDPANVTTNYLADPGSSTSSSESAVSFSFTVPAGGTYVLVVSEVNADSGCASYSLDVAGPDTTPPTATVTPPGPIAGPLRVAFSEIVHHVSSASLTLRVKGASTNLAGQLTCKDGSNTTVSCDTGDVRLATFQPASPLVPGQYYRAELNPPSAPTIADAAGNLLPDTTKPFRATTTSEEQSPAAVYAWRSVTNASASGGSYRVERLARAFASFDFTGASVSWITATGRDQGTAKVLVDGLSKGTVNNYAAGPFTLGIQRTFSGLGSGPHTIKIVVDGALGNAAGTNTRIVVDAFKVGTTLYPSPPAKYAWGEVSSSSAFAGGEAVTDSAGAFVRYTFRGTEIDWVGSTGPDGGKARILIDGAFLADVDTYSAVRTYKVVRGFAGLADAVHTIEIRALGTKRAASTGTRVTLDRFVIH